MMDICSIRYETHLLVHWWTVVEAIRKSQGFVPLSESCLGCHRLLFRFEGVTLSGPSAPAQPVCAVRRRSLRTAEQARASLNDLRIVRI